MTNLDKVCMSDIPSHVLSAINEHLKNWEGCMIGYDTDRLISKVDSYFVHGTRIRSNLYNDDAIDCVYILLYKDVKIIATTFFYLDAVRKFIFYETSSLEIIKELIFKLNDAPLNIKQERYNLNDKTKQILKSITSFFKNSKKLIKEDCLSSKGILFHGPPGTGKSKIVNDIYKVINKKYKMSAYVFDSRTWSNMAYKGLGVYDDIEAQFLTEKCTPMLTVMDGLNYIDQPRCWIFTTNEEIKHLYPALARPGRINEIYYFGLPTREDRTNYFLNMWKPIYYKDVDLQFLLNQTENMSYADLKNIKTYLILNFFETKKYDINLALEMHNRFRIEDLRHQEETRAKMGFIRGN